MVMLRTDSMNRFRANLAPVNRDRPDRGRAVEMLRLTQHGLFTAVVLVGFIRSLRSTSPAQGAAIGVALAGWYLFGMFLESRWRTTRVAAAWLGVLTVLCIGAVFLSSDYAWVSFALFILYASVLPPAFAYGAIGLLAVVVGAVLILRWPSDGHWLAQFTGPVIGAAAAAALVSVYRAAASESRDRQALIDELLIVQDDLARAHLDAGVRSERGRVAAEIHDTLAQGFASTVLLGRKALKSLDAGDTTAVEATLIEVVRIGSTGIDDARRLVRNLPPHELQDSGLADALSVLVSHSGDQVTLRIDGEPRRLEPPVETALLRVAQEGIANAVQHSGARRIVLTLTYRPDEISLDVVDDGVGFSPSNLDRPNLDRANLDRPNLDRPSDGFGIGVMARRIDGVGGTFSLEASPGSGTAVAASIPLGDGIPRQQSNPGRPQVTQRPRDTMQSEVTPSPGAEPSPGVTGGA